MGCVVHGRENMSRQIQMQRCIIESRYQKTPEKNKKSDKQEVLKFSIPYLLAALKT